MAQQTEPSTHQKQPKAISLEELEQLVGDGPMPKVEAHLYRGETLWTPGEPELSSAERRARRASIDAKLDAETNAADLRKLLTPAP